MKQHLYTLQINMDKLMQAQSGDNNAETYETHVASVNRDKQTKEPVASRLPVVA
jgi:hypothetical protein